MSALLDWVREDPERAVTALVALAGALGTVVGVVAESVRRYRKDGLAAALDYAVRQAVVAHDEYEQQHRAAVEHVLAQPRSRRPLTRKGAERAVTRALSVPPSAGRART